MNRAWSPRPGVAAGALILLLLASSSTGAGWAAVAPVLVEEGERLLKTALFEQAERLFRDALAQDARSAAAHLGLARVLAARRDLDLALGEADLAVGLAPLAADAYLTLASLREQTGDLAGAMSALDRYLESPVADDNPVRLQRARSHRALLRTVGRSPLRTTTDTRVGTIPFEIVRNKILFKASLNGRVPIDVLLDTGADHLVLSDATVTRAGLLRAGGGGAHSGPEMALAETFDVAGLTVRRVPAIVRREPLRVLPNRGGEAFSPLSVGLSLIVDYARKELTLARRLPDEAADVELPLYVPGLPVVAGSSGGTTLSFVVDTGSEATAVSRTVLSDLTVPSGSRNIPMRVLDAWGALQADAFLITPGIDLSFGAIRLPRFPVIVRTWPDVEAVHGFEMGGILGHDFLRRYRVSIDLTRRVVRLKRTDPAVQTSR